MKDAKFGYHWIWMLPIYYLMEAVDWIKAWFNKSRLKWILYRNPGLKRLRKNSGQPD
jgi:hypothetical protein